jgi:glutamate-1-semialdehyde aminotransferase
MVKGTYRIVRTNPFSVDYTDVEAVKALAKKLGSTVIKEPTRDNYNIIPTANIHKYPNAKVIAIYE